MELASSVFVGRVRAARFSRREIWDMVATLTQKLILVRSCQEPECLKCGEIGISAENCRNSVIKQGYWRKGDSGWWRHQAWFGRVETWPTPPEKPTFFCVDKCNNNLLWLISHLNWEESVYGAGPFKHGNFVCGYGQLSNLNSLQKSFSWFSLLLVASFCLRWINT